MGSWNQLLTVWILAVKFDICTIFTYNITAFLFNTSATLQLLITCNKNCTYGITNLVDPSVALQRVTIAFWLHTANFTQPVFRATNVAHMEQPIWLNHTTHPLCRRTGRHVPTGTRVCDGLLPPVTLQQLDRDTWLHTINTVPLH